MAKDKLTEYDATAANNTVVGDVNLAENSALPSDMNNAVREIMSHQKEAFGSGTPLLVDQTNNRVGVGVASPQSLTHFKGTASGQNILHLDNSAGSGHGDTNNNVRVVAGNNAYWANLVLAQHNLVVQPQGGSTAMTVLSNGQVGINTSSPSGANLEIFTGSTASDGLKINRFGSGVYYSTLRMDSHGLAVHVGDGSSISERAAITPNGLTFNGDTAAANALDDYEEGEFTYGFGVTSGSISVRSNYAKGLYTKVGRLVTIQVRFEANSLSSPTGDVYITGLPFASAAATSDRNNTQHYPTMFRQLTGVSDFGGGFITMIANATQARFQYNTHSGGVASIQGGDILSDFQGTVAFTYAT